jgi:type I restriction enzyme S subunit
VTTARWFGEIPDGWRAVPLYGVASERNVPNKGLRETNLLSLSYGRIVRKDIQANEGLLPASFETYQIVDPDDIVLRMTDLQNDQRSLRSALVEEAGIITSAYLALTLRNVDPRFMAYQFRAIDLMKVFYSMGGGLRQSIGFGDLKRLSVLTPPQEDQQAIADYLDRETTQIDAFIAKNEELIALLTERRAAAAQSEVEHHVGGGARLKSRLREIDVRAGSSWEKLPLLSVSIHHGVVPREEDPESANDSSDLSHYKIAKLGDIVLNRMRAFQGGLGVAPCEGLVSPDYAVLRPADGVDPAWLALVMRTPRFVGEMAMRLRGIGGTDSGAVRTPRISVADLGAILVSVPSAALQSAELQAVTTSTERIEKALMVAQRSVELARERRAALISAAVTGKIDVGMAR